MDKRQQKLMIFFSLVGMLSLLVLGSGLNQLELQPGLPFMDLWAFLVGEFTGGFASVDTGGVDIGLGYTIVDIVRTAYTIALICFPIALFLVLSSKESRKRFLRTLLFLIFLTILLSAYMVNKQPVESEDIPLGEAVVPENSLIPLETSIQETFEPSIPRWIVWTLSAVLALIVAGIAFVMYRLFHPQEYIQEPLPQIAEKARNALFAMGQGADFRNTILQCYADMLRIVKDQRGIQRNSAVTATEFINSLVKLGLPEDAVKQLTHLFEEVRYGSKQHTKNEEQTAQNSLRIIAETFKVTS